MAGFASVLAHVLEVQYLAQAETGHPGLLAGSFRYVGAILGYVLLPFTLVNRLLLVDLGALNDLLLPVGFGIEISHPCEEILDAYRYSGLLWESIAVLFLLLSWVFGVTLFCDLVWKLRERIRAKSAGTNSTGNRGEDR